MTHEKYVRMSDSRSYDGLHLPTTNVHVNLGHTNKGLTKDCGRCLRGPFIAMIPKMCTNDNNAYE